VNIDHGRTVDWGDAADDYARYRPGPPPSFYERLAIVGIGLPGQGLLDLGTGTGNVARQFATRGADVFGIDIAVASVLRANRTDDARVRYLVAAAEHLPFRELLFDVAIANQSWLYFDAAATVAELRRVLKSSGCLVTSHFNFMPRVDPIVRASEELVLRYNPDWTGGDWDGHVPEQPEWSVGLVTLQTRICYDEAIWFTREEWRGRIRALRGIGASLPPDQVEAFDREHRLVLDRIAPERFALTHRIDAFVFAIS
jgi:SAM-dependent methyltransferase